MFAEAVRDWPGVPRFSHELVDQSGMQPQEIEGELKVRLMQLVMLAAYHPDRPWRALVVDLIGMLSSLPPSGGINYVRVFLLYILQTQEVEEIELFQEALRRHAPQTGDDLMTYGQQLIEQGKIQERVAIIENLLELGDDWSRIEDITGVNEAQFEALKQRLLEILEDS